MIHNPQKNAFHLFIASSAIILTATATSPTASAQDYERGSNYVQYSKPDGTRVREIQGIVVNGPNRIADGPARDYGTLLGIPVGTTNFSELAIHNPDGEEPLPLTSDSTDSAVLASFIDPGFIELFGIDPALVDPALSNVPLQEVKTLVDGDGETRASIPGIFDSAPFSISAASPSSLITWGDWKKATGVTKVICRPNGKSRVAISFKDLVPNRIYTVWGAVVSGFGLFNQPFGGAPSAFVTDAKGNAKFKRKLNFCPMDYQASVDAQLMWIAVVLHSDHMVYGGVFSVDRFFAGSVTHEHMTFQFLGENIQ